VLVDVRTYRIRPSKMAQELELYAKYGLNAQTSHLGPPLAYLYGESRRHQYACALVDFRKCRRSRGATWRHDVRSGMAELSEAS